LTFPGCILTAPKHGSSEQLFFHTLDNDAFQALHFTQAEELPPLDRPSRVIMALTLLKPMPHLQGQRFSKSGKELSQLISVSVKAAPLLRNF
jgi:hypothetical protein